MDNHVMKQYLLFTDELNNFFATQFSRFLGSNLRMNNVTALELKHLTIKAYGGMVVKCINKSIIRQLNSQLRAPIILPQVKSTGTQRMGKRNHLNQSYTCSWLVTEPN
jgi:hypothetical protein